MRLIENIMKRLRSDEGHTMIAVVGAISLVSLLMGAAMAATNGDLRLTSRDLDDKRAYAAAQAGIADYVFHLNADNSYWTKCTSVPNPNAVNQQGSTAKRRTVPGEANATYAIELIPASGQTACSTTDPTTTMLESGNQNTGTFRIRSTGFAGDAEQAIVATFKRAGLLDYLYFTNLETSDPVTYGSQSEINGAYIQCTKYLREGRMDAPIPNSGGDYCTRIVFVSEDNINGPLHTNDALQICGTPTFGRTEADFIEVSSPPQGWSGHCSGNNPNFVGTYVTNAPVLTPPPTNSSLRNIPGTAVYTGQTRVVLSGTNIQVTPNGGSTTTIPIPASGVLYIANGSCSTGYSPFHATYPSTTGCGNVRVSGSLSGRLTIAAESDIIIEGDTTRSGDGMLGLIANNFVRVKHPICPSNNTSCNNGSVTSQTGKGVCNNGVNGTGSTPDLDIDAAILAINHSFIVDHYDCGSELGTLTVNGAIAQEFRGPVGTTGGTGYFKDYNYDDRLKYQEPPHFLDPVETAWHIQRQTLDFP